MMIYRVEMNKNHDFHKNFILLETIDKARARYEYEYQRLLNPSDSIILTGSNLEIIPRDLIIRDVDLYGNYSYN